MTSQQGRGEGIPEETRRRRNTLRFWQLFPLIWLVYLYFPLSDLWQSPQPVGLKALGTLGIAAFAGFWTQLYSQHSARVRLPRYPERHRAWVTAGYLCCLALFALYFALQGYSATTFLIYGAAIAGFQGSFRVALWGLVGVVFALFIPGWLGAGPLDVFNVVQLVLLSTFATYGNHAGFRQGVSQKRLAEMQLEKEKLAADAERERIARDLHDLLGHTLSVIVLKSELASKLAERDPARAAQEIREVERISREALSEVRAAVRGYQGSGLSAELARSKVALDAAGVALKLERTPFPVPPEIETALSMVLREAVTNVVRHARAAHCTIRIEQQAGEYLLDVHDDGIGGSGPEGSGLTGMRERVRALGGQLTLGQLTLGGELARDGERGTRLSVRFPLPAAAALPVIRATA
jgi:two-component system, NarL family, sensor histidine kinase DesK